MPVTLNELKTKEYKCQFYMRRRHPAPRDAINEFVQSVCESDAKTQINQWNDGPEGKIYEFDHVALIRTENEYSATTHQPWPINISHWELKGTAIYNLYYRIL